MRTINRHEFRHYIDGVQRAVRHRTKRSLYPTFHWPTDYKVQTQAFGINPRDYNKFGLPGHEGIDMRAYFNTPIRSVWDGEVSLVGLGTAYGHQIRIMHIIRGNKYESIYAHFSQPSHLSVGDKVQRGEIIGKADSTGNSTGHHLHFGLKQYTGEKPDTELQNEFDWPSNIVDPTPFFKELREDYE